MKYYSELTKQQYDTVEECEQAEEAKKLEIEEAEKKATAIANDKKVAADAVDEAERNLQSAYDDLEVAKREVKDLRDEYRKKIAALEVELRDSEEKVLEPAYDKVRAAQKKKFEAIQNFNEKYGTYKKLYTGERAAEEFARSMRQVEDFFKGFSIFNW